MVVVVVVAPSCHQGKDQVNLVGGGHRAIEHLKPGDRIWSLTPDGQTLIQDEIVMMMDSGINKAGLFSSRLSLSLSLSVG